MVLEQTLRFYEGPGPHGGKTSDKYFDSMALLQQLDDGENMKDSTVNFGCSDPLAAIPNLSNSKPANPSQNSPREDPDSAICLSCMIGVGGVTIRVYRDLFGLVGLLDLSKKEFCFSNYNSWNYNNNRIPTNNLVPSIPNHVWENGFENQNSWVKDRDLGNRATNFAEIVKGNPDVALDSVSV
ncbi:hypothetical protein L1887_36268 [Cichorium endivia]|nr:hypothetical protein L1887_36268 [Cichorium endivia]